ncbi:MAG: hypothetical protein RR929_03820 [Erysipelotrichaceae bacterium]
MDNFFYEYGEFELLSPHYTEINLKVKHTNTAIVINADGRTYHIKHCTNYGRLVYGVYNSDNNFVGYSHDLKTCLSWVWGTTIEFEREGGKYPITFEDLIVKYKDDLLKQNTSPLADDIKYYLPTDEIICKYLGALVFNTVSNTVYFSNNKLAVSGSRHNCNDICRVLDSYLNKD